MDQISRSSQIFPHLADISLALPFPLHLGSRLIKVHYGMLTLSKEGANPVMKNYGNSGASTTFLISRLIAANV